MNKAFFGTGEKLYDVDDANIGIRRYEDTAEHKPNGESGTVFTFELYQTRRAQLAFTLWGGLYYRRQDGTLIWQEWKAVSMA